MIQLNNITFPVFQLEKTKPIVNENLVYYHDIYKDKLVIVDDTTIPLDTLGKRRLQLVQKEIPLYKLNNAIYFIADLIKLTKGNQWYIDNSGTIFEYKKSKIVPLIFKEIKQIIPIKTGGAIVEVLGIPQRFKTMYLPEQVEYAGLLQISKVEYILYGLYKEKHKDTRRKI